MHQRSLLKAGVYGQTWKSPACGTDVGQFSWGTFSQESREHDTDWSPLFCTFIALLPPP